MKRPRKQPLKTPDYSQLTAAELRALLRQKDADLASVAEQKNTDIAQRDRRILLLEELLRLARLQRFAAKSEKQPFQIDLFDEAELEVTIEALTDQLPDVEPIKSSSSTRQRGFSEALERQRIELCLSEGEKAGAVRTFFTKVK